jgi:hypothetical protein
MFRRCVVIFVLVGFVASQLAAIPHAHGGHSPAEQSEHDARPHFHFGKCSHDHGHDHAHGHGHCHHSHPREETDDESQDQPLSDQAGGSLEHDANAVYLIAGSSNTVVVKVQYGAAITDCIALAIAAPSALASPSASGDDPALFRPPDEDSGGPKIFLTLRNLRI